MRSFLIVLLCALMPSLVFSADFDRDTQREISDLLKEGKLEALIDLLEKQDYKLKQQSEFNWYKELITAHVTMGQQAEGKRLYESALADHPKWGENSTWRNLRNFVYQADKGLPKVTLDFELEGNIRRAKQLKYEDAGLGLNRFIRETLANVSALVTETSEPGLYQGVAPAFRAAIEDEWSTYEPFLKSYLNVLKENGDATDETVKLMESQLSLAPELPPLLSDVPSPTAIPEAPPLAKKPIPVAHLRYGTLEWHPYLLSYGLEVTQASFPVPTIYKEWMLVQTSRHLAALKNGSRVWERMVDNTVFHSDKFVSGDQPMLYGGFRPTTDGKRVYARLLEQEYFSLSAFDLETGKQIWSFMDKDMQICADPVYWQGHLVTVAKTIDTANTYSLIMLSAEDGEVEVDIRLASGPPAARLSWDTGYWLRLDEALPPVTIDEDGMAYVTTHSGVVAAVQLRRGEVAWIREYPQIFGERSKGASDIICRRLPSSPVVGEKYVLFAPVNAYKLLLIDRQKGYSTPVDFIDWRQIFHSGRNQVLALSADRKNLMQLSMISLSANSEYKTKGEWAISQQAGDELLAANDGSVIVYDTNKVGRAAFNRIIGAKLPAGTQPLAVQQGVMTVIVRKSDHFEIQVIGTRHPTRQFKSPTRERDVTRLTNPRPKIIDGRQYLLSPNYLVALNDDLSTKWCMTTGAVPSDLFAIKNKLVLIYEHAIIMLDKETGEAVSSLPEEGKPVSRYGPALSRGHLLFYGVDEPDASPVIFGTDGERHQLFGTIKEAHKLLAIVNDGNTAICEYRHRRSNAYNFDPKEKVYNRVGESQKGRDAFPLDDGRALFLTDAENVALMDSDQFDYFHLARGRSYYENSWYETHGVVVGHIPTRTSNYLLVDTHTKKAINDSEHEFLFRPLITSDRVFGADVIRYPKEKKLPDKYVIRLFDRKIGKFMLNQEIPHEPFPQKLFAEYSRSETDFNLEFDGRLIQVVGRNSDFWRTRTHARAVYSIKPNGADFQVGLFPGFFRGSAAVVSGEQALLCFDSRLLRMSTSDLEKLLAPPEVLPAQKDDKFSVIINGYLDEWPTDTFQYIGRNQVAMIKKKDDLHIALNIQVPDLIERFAGQNLEKYLSLYVASADTLVVDPLYVTSGGFYESFTAIRRAGGEVSVTIHPNGMDMIVEARIPWKVSYNSPAYIGKNTVRNHFGDLCLDLMYDDPETGKPSAVIADDAHATQLLRFKF